MTIETGITITVYADTDYKFDVDSSELSLAYIESNQMHTSIGFGSLEEMEAVANAMLKAVKLAKE